MRYVARITAMILVLTLAGCASIAQRPQRLAPSSYGCMRAVVREKLPADLPQSRAHCLATGLIARYCSVAEAYLAAVGKELRDLLGPGDARWSDWRADRAGIECARLAADDAGLADCCATREEGRPLAGNAWRALHGRRDIPAWLQPAD